MSSPGMAGIVFISAITLGVAPATLKHSSSRRRVEKLGDSKTRDSRCSSAGAAERLNVGEERVRKLNPRLIYCSISGFGPTGPAAGRPAYDSVTQAASGFLGLLINPENPRVVGPALADSITGFYAAYGILGALHERNSTGVGRKVEVSMLEAMSHFNLDAFTHYYSAGEVMGPYSRPSVSQSYVMKCADEKWVALHMSSPEKFWQGLATAIEQPSLFQDPRFSDRDGRIQNQEALIQILGGIFAKHPGAEWCRRLDAEDVPYAPMYDTSEALEDPQAKHLELLVSAKHKTMGDFRTVRPPVSFDGQRSTEVVPPPVLGEHNEEVLGALRGRVESVRGGVEAVDRVPCGEPVILSR
ncbi:CaiB/BaiF CoA transferase family protein [Pollutimonas nitritireducens]|uniref:CaiB/BaiF CoA transferase family protein n=1 Tax=Pollutimonas nitritireducens TaxID=2045209 RepID=UPI001E2B441A|nr:CoA transferase [Pollutimonas nitritireducens]